MPTDSDRPPQTRWAHPAITLSLGAILGAAAWIGGNPATGVALFAVCAVTIFAWRVATARSEWFRETFEADERWGLVDMRAGRLAAVAMLTVLLAGFVYEFARGHSPGLLASLTLVIGSVTYTGAQFVFSRRL